MNFLYFILFGGTILIISAMLLIDYRQEVSEKTNIFSEKMNDYSGNEEDINKLLLPANELAIIEKNSLINLYLKTGEPEVYEKNKPTIKQKREEVYMEILKRQINRVSNRHADGFSIKPVPR